MIQGNSSVHDTLKYDRLDRPTGGYSGGMYDFADNVYHGHAGNFRYIWCCKGPRLNEEIMMPTIKTFIDNMTIAVLTEDHARAMLYWLDVLITTCRMSFKPKKCRSLHVAISFSVVNQMIPRV